MKKRIPTSLVLLCLLIPSLPVIAGSPQEQKGTVEEQMAALKDLAEDLKKFHEEAEKQFERLEPAQKRVTFSDKVLSFETLDEVETYEDLPKYGLVAPEQYNHRSGTNLVLLALKATTLFKGKWTMAHGLLGANMLDIKCP